MPEGGWSTKLSICSPGADTGSKSNVSADEFSITSVVSAGSSPSSPPSSPTSTLPNSEALAETISGDRPGTAGSSVETAEALAKRLPSLPSQRLALANGSS